jgi:hypothetical protein
MFIFGRTVSSRSHSSYKMALKYTNSFTLHSLVLTSNTEIIVVLGRKKWKVFTHFCVSELRIYGAMLTTAKQVKCNLVPTRDEIYYHSWHFALLGSRNYTHRLEMPYAVCITRGNMHGLRQEARVYVNARSASGRSVDFQIITFRNIY